MVSLEVCLEVFLMDVLPTVRGNVQEIISISGSWQHLMTERGLLLKQVESRAMSAGEPIKILQVMQNGFGLGVIYHLIKTRSFIVGRN